MRMGDNCLGQKVKLGDYVQAQKVYHEKPIWGRVMEILNLVRWKPFRKFIIRGKFGEDSFFDGQVLAIDRRRRKP